MLDGKRIAILAEDDFEDSELIVPMWGMKNAGAKVLIIGSGSKEIYQGKRGSVAIRVDTTADKVKAEDLDAIIIPGGRAPARMRKHKSMVDLVKKADELGKVIAAVCHGPQLLIAAGIVKGRRLTSWPSVAAELKKAGAEWIDEAVVRNGNLITSRKPADLPRFNKAIIEALRD
jgi:protease I